MAYSTYSSQLVIDYLFTASAVTRPNAWRAELWDGHPENGGAEVADTNYVDQAVTFVSTDADANGRREAVSDVELVFPAMDASATVSHVVIVDQTGNRLAILALASARNLSAGDVFSIPSGDLIIKGE